MSLYPLLERLAFAGILLATAAHWKSCRADWDVLEQKQPLAVAINGHPEQLEALIVRPLPEGRFPIVLIVNGAFPHPQEAHPEGLAALAHDFAHRGYLAASVVWRGYGKSSGQIQFEAGNCSSPDTARFLDAHADDLAAALSALRRRPDVDPAVALGLGFSIGGVSMLDLAARPGHPLTAVINISGGLYHNARPFAPDPTCGPFEADLVREISLFGVAGIPTLWVYAENDPWFRPELVRRMLDVYRAGGGKADLTMFPPFGTDGHTLFRWAANDLTQPVIDRFLRANQLPAMEDDSRFAPLLAKFNAGDRDSVERYLRAPTEKALAVPTAGNGAYWHYASPSIEDARMQALAECAAATKTKCHVIAENKNLLDIKNTTSSDGPD